MKPYCSMTEEIRYPLPGGGRRPCRGTETASPFGAGADVRPVSPVVTPVIKEWSATGVLRWKPWSCRNGDGEGGLLVSAATAREDGNRQVHHDTMASGRWGNVADQPALCNFTVPSVMRRGRLAVTRKNAEVPEGRNGEETLVKGGESHA
ncbi:precorrin-2 dehydrogenase/sirohydrochlorin ferrochelatase family protein [Staphylospora marina]|uniref:precorrin-2 dehydrogenase/sirohydrochlorin ferrochelatase family protein n=1 Tax=Staphylospora marina TaxID=2490858 RepID=UPI000F5BA3ED|nr:NAD(P)-dependent oxidoreductase [Staphylospora marina]